jgi:putative restriction endonuclease
MSRESILKSFGDLHRAKWHGEEAPHKPLLVLLALSRWLKSGQENLPFATIEDTLADLIRKFGFLGSSSIDPRLPFWHLTHDRVWRVLTDEGKDLRYSGRRPTRNEPLEQNATGGFSCEIITDLKASPAIAWELVGCVLAECFQPSSQEPLLRQLGLWLRA